MNDEFQQPRRPIMIGMFSRIGALRKCRSMERAPWRRKGSIPRDEKASGVLEKKKIN
jgi:hypothetical protein